MEQGLVFDPEILRRYDVSGPRYTSYPTAPQFHEGFDEEGVCEGGAGDQCRRCASAAVAVCARPVL